MSQILPAKGLQYHHWFVPRPIPFYFTLHPLRPRIGDFWTLLGRFRSPFQGHDRPPRMSGTFCARRDLGWRGDAELWWLQGQKKVRQVVFFPEVARNPSGPPQEVCALGKLQGQVDDSHTSTIEPDRSQVWLYYHFRAQDSNNNFSSFSSDSSVEPATYQCYGISNHSGTLHGGHYVASCRHPYNPDAWHHYNDRSVSGMTSDRVITPEAYLLFFQRVSPKWNKSFWEIWNASFSLLSASSNLFIQGYYVSLSGGVFTVAVTTGLTDFSTDIVDQFFEFCAKPFAHTTVNDKVDGRVDHQ